MGLGIQQKYKTQPLLSLLNLTCVIPFEMARCRSIDSRVEEKKTHTHINNNSDTQKTTTTKMLVN